MAGSSVAQEGVTFLANALSPQPDRQMVTRPMAYLVGTFLALVSLVADTPLELLCERGALLANSLLVQTAVLAHTLG